MVRDQVHEIAKTKLELQEVCKEDCFATSSPGSNNN